MKPADHPDFFRLPPPPGTSRESSIRLDEDGQFWQDGDRISNPALHAALTRWIARHPEDGRYILTNGYDWTYFQVDDAPYQIRWLRLEPERVVLALSDASEEALDPASLRVGHRDALYAQVKGGCFPARFTRHAQTQLEPLLVVGESSRPELEIAGQRYAIEGASE